MELWVILSILSGFLWAITNVADSVILNKITKNIRIPLFIGAPFGILMAGIIFAFTGSIPSLSAFAIGLLGGSLTLVAVLSYYRAVQLSEVSRVVPLFALVGVFVTIWAAIFLGERFEQSEQFKGFLAVAPGMVERRQLFDNVVDFVAEPRIGLNRGLRCRTQREEPPPLPTVPEARNHAAGLREGDEASFALEYPAKAVTGHTGLGGEATRRVPLFPHSDPKGGGELVGNIVYYQLVHTEKAFPCGRNRRHQSV